MLADNNTDETQTTNQTTLLLVDDDPLIADSFGYMLGQHYDVVITDTREKAIATVAQMSKGPKLALVDLGLPPKPHRPDEGFALIKELLAFDKNIKILVLSGQDEDVNIQHALSIGAVDFIAKPVESTLLLSRLDQHNRLYDIEQKKSLNTKDDFIGECASIDAIKNR